MQFLNNSSINGTLLTIALSAIGLNEIDIMSKIVFMLGSSTTAIFTCLYTYKKIKNLKNEKIDK
jgi:hypothetical protein